MLFSTSYFGTIPYFQELVKQSTILIDAHENYQKQTWRNRTAILSADGTFLISVPVERPYGKNTKIKDVVISNATNWQKDHWKAIESCYKHAPFFYYYEERIHELIYQKEQNLLAFNSQILKQLLDWLDFEIIFEFSEQEFPYCGKDDIRILLNQKVLSFPQEKYIQVFSDVQPFTPNLSILDLLLNEGPMARNYLTERSRE